MALDRSKLHKGFQTYPANAEKASGKTYEDFSLVLSKSGLKKHGELRSHLMESMGLGHGHANAVVAIWLMPGNGGPAPAVEKPPVKGPVKKAAQAPMKNTSAKPKAKKQRPSFPVYGGSTPKAGRGTPQRESRCIAPPSVASRHLPRRRGRTAAQIVRVMNTLNGSSV